MENTPEMKKPTPITNEPVSTEPKVMEEHYQPQLSEEKAKKPKLELSPEQKEIASLMASDHKFVAVRQIMELRNRVSEAGAIKDNAINRTKSMIPDDKYTILEARAMNLDEDELLKLDMKKEEDWQKVLAVYSFDDGSKIHFSNEPDTKDIKCREMHRDYLVYIRRVRIETEKFEKFEKDTQAEIDKLYEELDNIIGKEEGEKIRNYATFADYYRDWIVETLKREDLTENVRNRLNKTLDADNRGVRLDFIEMEIRNMLKKRKDTSSIKWGFRNNFSNTAEAATAVLAQRFAKYNFHLAFNKFYDLETRVLGFEDAKYNNLFMFLLFRYIKHHYERFDNYWMITLGEVVTQIGFLFKPKENRPASSIEFEKNVKNILELVINH